jgi:hypothetical protein
MKFPSGLDKDDQGNQAIMQPAKPAPADLSHDLDAS